MTIKDTLSSQRLAARRSTWGPRWRLALALLMILVASVALHRHVAQWRLSQLILAIRSESFSAIVVSAALTAVSFAMLGIYDALGCSVVIPGKVSIGTAMFAGASGNAVSNTLGFHVVTGTAVRLRIYSAAGVLVGDALRVIALSWLGIAAGLVALIATAASFRAGRLGAGLPAWAPPLLVAIAALMLVRALPASAATLRLGRARLELPSRRIAIAFVAVGFVENAAAIAALFALLPQATAPSFAQFAVSYAAAVGLGVMSQVPGGLGVFEAAIVTVWGSRVGPGLLPALVVYRTVYNLVPFLVACLSIAAWELARMRKTRRAQFERG